MFSKEEAKQVREDFWTFFGKRYHRKWTLYNTGIKDIVLKFSMENHQAMVSLDIQHDDEFFRAYFFEKLVSLKTLLSNEVDQQIILDPMYRLESGRYIARIYCLLEPVKITRKTDWPRVYEFFYDRMDRLEKFFWEYKDYIED